jgi:putative FmdB family regulatory protein
MPTYVYKAKSDGCPYCSNSFEEKQSMKEPPLAKCPKCGAEVERVIVAPFVRTGRSDASTLSSSNLKKHGFTKLINEGDGKFRKTW